MGRFVDLDKDCLRNVLSLSSVPQHAKDQIQDRLFVTLDQPLKSSHIALLDSQHQGGIRVLLRGHHPRT